MKFGLAILLAATGSLFASESQQEEERSPIVGEAYEQLDTSMEQIQEGSMMQPLQAAQSFDDAVEGALGLPIQVDAPHSTPPVAALGHEEVADESTLNYSLVKKVKRVLKLQEKLLDDEGGVLERSTLQADAILVPLEEPESKVSVRIQRLQVENETFGNQASALRLDTDSSWSGSPLIWWRSRPLRSAIADPTEVIFHEDTPPAIVRSSTQHGAIEDLVMATVQSFVCSIERIFAERSLVAGESLFVAKNRIGADLLGEGLLFELVEVNPECVIAKFCETGENLGVFQGMSGNVSWSCHNPLCMQFEQRGDYYFKKTDLNGLSERCAVRCDLLIQVNSTELDD